MGRPLVFISYLRASGSGWAFALFERLRSEGLQPDEVFFDRKEGDIPSGNDFWIEINAALETCQVVLAIIDEHWEESVVRIPPPVVVEELGQGIAMNRVVIPLLVNDARFPRQLPKGLGALGRITALSMPPDYWSEAIGRLIKRLNLPHLRDAAQREIDFAGPKAVSVGKAAEDEGSRQRLLYEVANLSPADRARRLEELRFDESFIGGTLSPEEQAMIRLMEPEDQARYLLQKRMQEKAEKAALLSQLQSLRHQTAMSVINNIR
jgi:TIR domain